MMRIYPRQKYPTLDLEDPKVIWFDEEHICLSIEGDL